MLSAELESDLRRAFSIARVERHSFITVEHLCLALLENASALQVLRACGIRVESLAANLQQHVGLNTPREGGSGFVDTEPTIGFERTMQRAAMRWNNAGSDGCPNGELQGADVLLALFGLRDCYLAECLERHGVRRAHVLKVMVNRSPKPEGGNLAAQDVHSHRTGFIARHGARAASA